METDLVNGRFTYKETMYCCAVIEGLLENYNRPEPARSVKRSDETLTPCTFNR
jgi:hypothetical protein